MAALQPQSFEKLPTFHTVRPVVLRMRTSGRATRDPTASEASLGCHGQGRTESRTDHPTSTNLAFLAPVRRSSARSVPERTLVRESRSWVEDLRVCKANDDRSGYTLTVGLSTTRLLRTAGRRVHVHP